MFDMTDNDLCQEVKVPLEQAHVLDNQLKPKQNLYLLCNTSYLLFLKHLKYIAEFLVYHNLT